MTEYEGRTKVYEEALKTFGPENQLIVALEELSECQKEICKALRGNVDREHLAEEVADATIMLEQIRRIFGLYAVVDVYMDRKVARLWRRTREAQAANVWEDKNESGLLEE